MLFYSLFVSLHVVKCAIGANNALIPTFTAFQYPTTMRNLGVGVGNFAAGIALIVVPNLWLLEHVQKHLPMTVMGVFGVIGAIALFMMKDKSPIKKSEIQHAVIIDHIDPSSFKASGLDNFGFKAT